MGGATGATDTCTAACAAGSWDNSDVCQKCTLVTGALSSATYTCTSAADSRVSACAQTTTTKKTVGAAGATDTCTAPKPAAEPEPEPATPSAGPKADEVVVLTQTLAITGATAAEVCTDANKETIAGAIATAIGTKNVKVTKCADKKRRRSLLAAGVDLEYQVTLAPAEAKEKQAEIVKTMATLEGESEATTSVLAAVAKATGKDVSTLTVKGNKAVVTINKAELVVSAANTASIGVVSIIVATIAAATGL